MSFAYLLALGVSAAGMLIIDRRFRLVFWDAPWRAAAVIAIGALAFFTWDMVAIANDFYYLGSSPHMTGWEIAPELPIEEVAFILFFCHISLVFYRGAHRLLAYRARRRAEAGS